MVEPQEWGIADILDWTTLEELLEAGEFPSKAHVKEYVAAQFTEAEEVLTRSVYWDVIAGLFPEVRELYAALPNTRKPPAHLQRLTLVQVEEIRSRREAGETTVRLGEAFGVNRRTVSDIVNGKIWKQEAA